MGMMRYYPWSGPLIHCELGPPLEDPDYKAYMFQVLDTIEQTREEARGAILQNKARIEQQYNRRVKQKTFDLGDLVWRAILPLGSKDPDIGKWSPNWEGPYEIHQVLGKNVYRLKDLAGEVIKRMRGISEGLSSFTLGQVIQQCTGANDTTGALYATSRNAQCKRRYISYVKSCLRLTQPVLSSIGNLRSIRSIMATSFR